MRARGAAIQGGLAALGLLAVYGTWRREPEKAPGDVVVVDLVRADLTKVHYSDGAKKTVDLEKIAGKEGVWMRIAARSDTKPPTPERLVRASEQGEKLFERFAPLRAVRSLGAQSKDKLKEMGFDDAKKVFELTARGQQIKFLVGNSPFGASDPYVKDERDGRVYLFGASIVSELDAADKRFVDRTMHAFTPEDVESVELSAPATPGKKREWTRGPGSTPTSLRLASKKDPSKADELAGNWHEKLWRLYPIDVLGEGEQPATGAPKVIVRIDYRAHGKEPGFVELARGNAPVVAPPAAGAPTPAPPPAEVFARTEKTAGWVKLAATADDLVKEGEKLAQGE